MTSSKRRAALKTLAAASLAPLLSACAVAPPRPPAIARDDYDAVTAHLGALIPHELAAANISGLSIALLDDQRVVWADGFGHADKAAGVGATARTRYRAGSISKLFTAAALMQLAESGKLDIDAPLERALPGFSIRGRDAGAEPISARMIMSHHAGLPSDRIEGMWSERPAHFTSVVDALRDEYRAFPPNLVHAYSNTGFSVLGAAIERLAGAPYERVMRAKLLTPLGMDDSDFDTAPPDGPRAARAYDGEGRLARKLPLRDTPAGGLNSTAPDLLRLARMWFAGGVANGARLLSAASLAEMARPQNGACALDADLRVGLGWHFAPEAVRGGGPVLFHNGATQHHRAVLMLLPEHRLAVAVMANSANAMETAIRLAGQTLGLALEAKTGIAQRAAEDLAADPRYPAAAADALPGHYATELGYLTIRRDGARLLVDAAGKTLAMTPRKDGYSGLEYRLLGLFTINLGQLGQTEFTRARIAGREVLLARRAGVFLLAGEKIEPRPVPAAWLARLGAYRYTGRDAFIAAEIGEIRLKLEDGFLLAEIGYTGGVVALDAAGDDAAIVRGLGRGRGETVHARRAGAGETLHYAGLTFSRKDAAA